MSQKTHVGRWARVPASRTRKHILSWTLAHETNYWSLSLPAMPPTFTPGPASDNPEHFLSMVGEPELHCKKQLNISSSQSLSPPTPAGQTPSAPQSFPEQVRTFPCFYVPGVQHKPRHIVGVLRISGNGAADTELELGLNTHSVLQKVFPSYHCWMMGRLQTSFAAGSLSENLQHTLWGSSISFE